MATHMTLSPQCADILTNLRGGPCTSLALQRATGVMAVGARIHELRIALQAQNLAIETRLIEVRNRHRQRCHVAEYSLRRVPTKRPARRAVKKTAKAKRA